MTATPCLYYMNNTLHTQFWQNTKRDHIIYISTPLYEILFEMVIFLLSLRQTESKQESQK